MNVTDTYSIRFDLRSLPAMFPDNQTGQPADKETFPSARENKDCNSGRRCSKPADTKIKVTAGRDEVNQT